MELDELKNTWTVLEKQLKKNETLNKQLLLEMLRKKSNKSLNWLVNTDFFNIIIWLLAIPAGIWIYNAKHHFRGDFLSIKIFAVVFVVMSVVGVIGSCYGLKYLLKIDFSKSVKDNIYCITKYDTMVKQSKIVTYIMFFVMTLLGAFCYYELHANISHWTFLIVVVSVCVIISFWMYKKIYDPNIQSIKQNLDELKEQDD